MSLDDSSQAGIEEVFTQSEVAKVLEATDLDEGSKAAVVEAFIRFAGDRALAQYELGLSEDVVDLAVIYERVEGEGASDSNIEGWYERLEAKSKRVLRNFADREDLNQTQVAARNFAAHVYIGLSRQANSRIDIELLQNAGLSEVLLVGVYRKAMFDAAVAHGTDTKGLEEKINTRYPTLNSIAGGVIRLIWPGLITPLAKELRARLIAEGQELPVLNEDGLYAEEIED